MTRKVILFIATSIDGYIADKSGGVGWLDSATEIIEEDHSYEAFYEKVDTVILGRTTYDQVVNELAPGNYPYEDVTSYVITSRGTEDLAKVHFTNESVVNLVRELKASNGGTIWIVGGSSVVMPLVNENLIDEYQLSTMPILLGQGISLFQEMPKSLRLQTGEVHLKNGIVTTTYFKQ
ncbi:dihydrofolate reductase [Vagococcus sp. BWB3-3]|uniref:Dihydrofolate reductase n=1 Tax=Vagococcus allomyrinae TaxID=2794353 RepID=A0A940PJ29_9ENTE|nr:dihydrofolate reductase family protein [Vagococcus allomyrinae]MBP1044496.1 dihydrofolate reductase [Vagococcus allomyrinae]